MWWARRPLTPSRAAIVASWDIADTDPETFVRQLGIERMQALLQGAPCTLDEALRVRHIPPALRRRLAGLLFDVDLPSVGDEGFVDAPQPLIQASLDAMCRLANGLKRRRADLATADVISRLEREIDRLVS